MLVQTLVAVSLIQLVPLYQAEFERDQIAAGRRPTQFACAEPLESS